LVDVGTVFENDLHRIGNREYRALRCLEYLDHIKAWRATPDKASRRGLILPNRPQTPLPKQFQGLMF